MRIKVLFVILFAMNTISSLNAKTVVINPSAPIQHQFNRKAKYVIKDIINLDGVTLNVPKRSKLLFDGGSIRNGEIVFNKTTLQGNPLILAKVSGSVTNAQLYVNWFLVSNDLDYFFNSKSSELSGYSELVFSEKEYSASVRKMTNGLQLKDIIVEGNNCTIRAKQGCSLLYSVFPLYNSENVTIRNMTIIGSEESSSIEGARHNLCITSCKNITVDNIDTRDAFTDGVYIRDNDGVYINNLRASNNGRQGCSITSGSNIEITNSSFSGSYRTAPKSGLDIEPSLPNDVITGVSISECSFSDNVSSGLTIFLKECDKLSDVDINISDCVFSGNGNNISVRSNPHSGTGDIRIANCKLSNSRGVAFQSKCYSSSNTPHISLQDCEMSNVNMADGTDVRENAAFISIHNLSSQTVNTDVGNISINNVSFSQGISTKVYRTISLYVDTDAEHCLDNIEISDVDYKGKKVFTDSYNDYFIYVPQGKHKNIKLSIPYEVPLSKSVSQALTPAPTYVVSGTGVISLKGQIRPDLFSEINIICKGNCKVKDLASSPIYYYDGTLYDNKPLGGTIKISNGKLKNSPSN